MPILAVAAGGNAQRRNDLGEVVRPGRVPEADRVGAEVDLVGLVMPDSGVSVGAPLRVALHAPPQQRIRHARGTRQQTGLELGEVALEDADLVLARLGRGVDVAPHKREVVEHLALVHGGRGLRYELGAAHRLPVPVGRAVQGDLGALLGPVVGRVLVRGEEVDVGCYLGGAVDVVLVGPDLVGSGPVVEVG